MPTALVTGANGFIGSHLVRELLERDYTVRCLVRPTGDLSSLHGLPVALYLGDVRDPLTLEAPFMGVDYVFHLAAELMVASASSFLAANTQGTLNVLEAAHAHAGPSLQRVLFVSSQAAAGPAPAQAPIDETHPPEPISWYGTSKWRAERTVLEWGDRLPVTIVRPSSVYGARERDISQTFPLVEKRIQPKLGLRAKYLNMVYVGDLVQGIVMAAESPNTRGQTYFLNHAEEVTARGTTRAIAEAMDKRAGLVLPVPTGLLRLAAPLAELPYQFTGGRPALTRDKAREVSQRYWLADPSKAERDFGWRAERTLVDGMRQTIPHHRAERAKVRRLDGERGATLWLKFVLVATAIGAVIEITSALGGFYTFTPPWAVLLIVFVAFGLGLGTLAFLLRKRSGLVQFLAGTALAAAVELLNEAGWLPGISWTFAPGWPFGITNGWVRAVLLGTAGGFIVLLVTAVLRAFYKRRLRTG